MVEIIQRQRKSPVLTPSTLPCLQKVATLNVTEGCALGCTYCYIQGYSKYPGPERIVLYENLPELVADELQRKRRKPQRVYFSPSSDAFQYPPQVQDVTLRTMQVLLEAGVEVAFLTKGFIRQPILDLFVDHADLVFAQIGITTLDQTVWRMIEPRTAPPEMRVETIRKLIDMRVQTTARLDPLFPDLTDTVENLLPLLRLLAAAGIREAATSYAFTRAPFERKMATPLALLTKGKQQLSRWTTQTFQAGAGRGKMIALEDRSRRFDRLTAMGNSTGIRIRPCRCKNPELANEPCAITGPVPDSGSSAHKQAEFLFGKCGNECGEIIGKSLLRSE